MRLNQRMVAAYPSQQSCCWRGTFLSCDESEDDEDDAASISRRSETMDRIDPALLDGAYHVVYVQPPSHLRMQPRCPGDRVIYRHHWP
jgi:hypothetical protein